MDPGTLMLLASAASAAGAVASGNAQSSAMRQQASASEANARMADVQAQQAYAAGALNETQQRKQQEGQLGQIRASVSESGFDPNSGTALDVQRDSVMNAEMDALQTRYEGLLRGDAFTGQAAMDRYTSKTLRSSAKNAKTTGYVSAAASLLSGAAGYGLAKTGGGLTVAKNFGNTGKFAMNFGPGAG